jgi:hypothetical protein
MFAIQLLGTRCKVDFTMYLAHAIASQNKRVLVVDATTASRYMVGLGRLESEELLYEVQDVEMIAAASWNDLKDRLTKEGENINNYDVVLVDIDSIAQVTGQWPAFDTSLYVSDDNRFHMQRDVALLHRYLDEHDNKPIRRLHFKSQFKLPETLIELLMNNRIEFTSDSEEIEFDEQLERLFIMMQHNQIIPYHKLTKEYKSILNEYVVEWFGLDRRDVQKAAKPTLFGKYKSKKVPIANQQ